MSRWKKIGAWILAVLLIFLLFAIWYKQNYSMKVAEPYEVNSPSHKDHILIATQGSEFKDSLVHELVRELRTQSVFIKVIDISDLTTIKEEEWTAIILLHTWENWEPQEDAKYFIEQVKDKRKLIVLSTSGQGSYRIENIDGITSPSKLSDVSDKAKEITSRVTKLLWEENK